MLISLDMLVQLNPSFVRGYSAIFFRYYPPEEEIEWLKGGNLKMVT